MNDIIMYLVLIIVFTVFEVNESCVNLFQWSHCYVYLILYNKYNHNGICIYIDLSK